MGQGQPEALAAKLELLLRDAQLRVRLAAEGSQRLGPERARPRTVAIFVLGAVGVALIVACGRALLIIARDGQILDTILYSMATPLARVPGVMAAVLMVPVHALLHVPVPSMSTRPAGALPASRARRSSNAPARSLNFCWRSAAS